MNGSESPACPGQFLEKQIERLTQTNSVLQNSVRILEEENALLISLLKQNGIDARMPSQMSTELPPPIMHPLDLKMADIFNGMKPAEQQICKAAAENHDVFLVLSTRSKVDTGRWFRGSRIWVLAMANEIVLFAAGKRPFLAKIGFTHLQESLYNHVTGAVIFAPVKGLAITTITVSPANGYQLLAQIYADKKSMK